MDSEMDTICVDQCEEIISKNIEGKKRHEKANHERK